MKGDKTMNETKSANSVISLLNDVFYDQWNNEAFCDYATSVFYTHKEVYDKILGLHTLYNNLGLKKGDKVVICDKNSCNWAICFLSVFTYGCVAVPLLPDFHHEQICALIRHSETKLVFCNGNLFDKIKHQIDIPAINLHNFTPYDASMIVEDYDNEEFHPFDNLWKYEDLAILSYTSGSTGNPKGVMIPYRSLWSNVTYARKVFPEVTSSECFISMLPLAHMFGLAFEFLLPFTCGCTISFMQKAPTPRLILSAFHDVQPYLVITVPLVIEKIVRNKVLPQLNKPIMRLLLKIPFINSLIYRSIRKKLTNAFGSHFREIIFGGAGLSKDIEELLRKVKLPYTSGYGMTECGPLISFVHCGAPQGTCGKVVDNMEVKILSDNPETIPGEIVVKGMNTMLGYYKNETATHEAIDSDGWLHTGDLGTVDKEGYIYIRGRKKNMLLGANGQNVYPEELENKVQSLMPCDETIVVQRDNRFVALVYVSDVTLQTMHLTREQFDNNIKTYLGRINNHLPRFSRLATIELYTQEFEKTPKRNIKRYLYQ